MNHWLLPATRGLYAITNGPRPDLPVIAAQALAGGARAALGEQAIIGVSCRDSLQCAQTAVRAGANYVSFGAFFRSPTKPLAPRAPIDLLRQSATLGVPRVAIGGITPDNGGSLIEAGADYLAVISAVFGAADVRQAAQRINDLYSSPFGAS